MSRIKDIIKDKNKELKPGENVISKKLASFWKEQVNTVDGEKLYKNWQKRGAQVVRRFRDERSNFDGNSTRKMNLLWTNYNIMKPAVYSDEPVPNIDRKFSDKDPISRLSATMLERSVRNELEFNRLHSSINRAVRDYLLPGRGQVWVRYEPEIGEGPSIPSAALTSMGDDLNKAQNDGEIKVDDTPEEEKLESTGEQIISEGVPVDYVDWRDFKMFPADARTWDEVQAVGKRLYISKEEAIERFGEDIGRELRPDTTTYNSKEDYGDTGVFKDINERSIVVYEIWNKTDRRVYWISTGYDYLCDVRNDPLKLRGFFPCPEPLSATMTNETTTPVPDFWEWQDQALQIDEMTQRIAMLTKACKIAGTYDASNGGLKRLLNESSENQLIPVDQWAVHAEKGGVKGSISFLPLEEIQSCIATLQEVRQQAKQDLDEVTGLSDILRGTTDSRETLGGLRIKNNNAGTRLSDRQNDVARFATDIVKIVAEIAAKHFTDETLIKSSGILYDEELLPETVLAELQAKFAPAMPPAAMAGAKPGAPMQPSPAPQGAPGLPPQQPPTNNVVPFPPQPQAPMAPPGPMMGHNGGPPMPMPLPEQQGPTLEDAQMEIAHRVQKAIDLLRNDIERGYRIEIETDSTIFGDRMQERADAIEFVEMTTKFIGEAGQVGQQMPEAVPLFGQMLGFVIRKFKAGRDLESSINTFIEKAAKKAKEMEANPPPDPEQQKAELEMKITAQQAQVQAENDQRDAQKQQANDEREAQMKAADDNRQLAIAQMDSERKERMAQMEMQLKEREFAMQMQQMDKEAIYKQKEHEMNMKELELKQKENAAKRAERKNKPKGKAA